MTYRNHFEYGRYFFHFGTPGKSPPDGLPLVCLNGGIMADTGSEALAYIITCQDRYPVYAALGGMRCLLFVRNDEHVWQYQKKLFAVSQHLDTIKRFTGLLLNYDLPEPLYMPCDLNCLEVPLRPAQKFLRQIRDPQVLNSHVLGGIYLTQVSPTIFKLLNQFYGFLQDNGYNLQIRLGEYHHMAQCALQWHDKSNYVELLRQSQGSHSLPPHVPTAMFSSPCLIGMAWERFIGLVQQQIGNIPGKDFLSSQGWMPPVKSVLF